MLTELGRLALPLCIAQLASIGIMTADVVMMGQLSTFDMAAGSLAVRLYQPFYFFALGLLSVISALVAQSLGANQPDTARRVFRQGLILSFGLGVLFMLPVLAGEALMIMLGQGAAVAERRRGHRLGAPGCGCCSTRRRGARSSPSLFERGGTRPCHSSSRQRRPPCR